MSIFRTAVWRVRAVGTAAGWLAVFDAVYLAGAWLGAGGTVTALHPVMVDFFVALGAVWGGCWLVTLVAEVRRDAAVARWRLAQQAAHTAASPSPAAAAGEPVEAVEAVEAAAA